jgi:hypothetical protein
MRPVLLLILATAALAATASPVVAATSHTCRGTSLDGGNIELVATGLHTYRADARRALRCMNARRVAKAYLAVLPTARCPGLATKPCTIAVRGLGKWGCYLVATKVLSSHPATTQCEALAGWTLRWQTRVVAA